MDNEPDSGLSKKPQRPASRPTSGGRKPAATAKPTAKPSAKPAAKPAVKPAATSKAMPAGKSDVEPAVVAVPGHVGEARGTEPRVDPTAKNQPRERLSVPRLSVARLSLPKLTIPKLAVPALAARSAPTSVEDAAIVDEPIADEQTADEPAEEQPIERPVEEQPLASDAPIATSPSTATSTALTVRGLTKSFDGKLAVDGIDLDVHVGAFYGIVGPNGAGKTTTLSMITGLLRPTAGTITVNGADVWSDPVAAKRAMGVLPDRLRLFDRLTGSQVLYYAGVLRGLNAETVRKRTADLAQAFGLEESLGRLVTDYSAGMTKKIALAAAMIHTPRLLVLDEPFESVDPVSAATVTEILKNYVAYGGTVVLSSHSMDLVQRICDHVAVIVNGVILADGTMAEVRNGLTLEERFVELAGGRKTVEGLEWLHTFSD